MDDEDCAASSSASPCLHLRRGAEGFQWTGKSLVSILTDCSVVIHTSSSPSPSAASVHRAAAQFLCAFTHEEDEPKLKTIYFCRRQIPLFKSLFVEYFDKRIFELA